MTRRAIIYARISDDKTGAELGVGRQRADCEALAAKLGWTVVTVYTDNDTSAYRGVRRGYKALLDDLDAGRADALLAWHHDRLHRSPAELEKFITLVEAKAVEVHFVMSGDLDLTTSAGRLSARIAGAVARHESEHRGERVAAARRQMAEQGRWAGGSRAFGYTPDGSATVPSEAAVIEAATELILEGGSLRAAVRLFQASGLPTTTGLGRWEQQTVRLVLTRRRNAGLVVYRGEVLKDVTAGWPAIITPEQLTAMTAKLNDPGRRTSSGSQPRWLGSLLYTCGVCGEGLVVGTNGGTGGRPRVRSYYCRGHADTGTRHVSHVVASLDLYVVENVIAWLDRPEAVEATQPDPVPDVDVAGLRRELLALEHNRNALGARLNDKRITMAQFDAFNDDMAGRQRALESELARATTTSPLARIAGAPDVREQWEACDLEAQRTIIRALMNVAVMPGKRGRLPDGSRFDPDRIVVTWR